MAYRNATTSHLLAEQRPKPYRRFERTHFGDLWQADAMHGPKLPDPANPGKERQVFLFAWLDDHTRLVPHAQFYWNEQLPRLEDCFKRAMLRYGRPLSIYVDRAKVHVSKQLDTICATLGIQRILGTPYYPEGRGKIERFFQFVQSDFLPELSASSVDTLPLLNESLMAWIEVVYHTKVHSETGQAPLERYRQDEAPSTRPAWAPRGRAWYERARAEETAALLEMYARVARGRGGVIPSWPGAGRECVRNALRCWSRGLVIAHGLVPTKPVNASIGIEQEAHRDGGSALERRARWMSCSADSIGRSSRQAPKEAQKRARSCGTLFSLDSGSTKVTNTRYGSWTGTLSSNRICFPSYTAGIDTSAIVCSFRFSPLLPGEHLPTHVSITQGRAQDKPQL